MCLWVCLLVIEYLYIVVDINSKASYLIEGMPAGVSADVLMGVSAGESTL